MEICAVSAGREDRRTDNTKLNSHLSQFAKAPIKGQLILKIIAVQTLFIAEVKPGRENLRYCA
jgi:hypothetical protein